MSRIRPVITQMLMQCLRDSFFGVREIFICIYCCMSMCYNKEQVMDVFGEGGYNGTDLSLTGEEELHEG